MFFSVVDVRQDFLFVVWDGFATVGEMCTSLVFSRDGSFTVRTDG
jgi:hypothetical protein